MKLLAVETTGAIGSLAVAEIQESDSLSGFRVLSTRRWQKKSTHSEVITLECMAALAEAGIDLDSITHLACDVGPGSFTGIRVGLNLVRSLAYALHLRARLFQSLEILAFENLKVDQSGVIALPAVQEFFYAGAYRRSKSGIQTLHPAESLGRSGLDLLKNKTKVDELIFPKEEPKVETIVSLIGLNTEKSNFIAWESIQPLYIRASEAEEKLRKGLLKPVS